SLLLFVMFMAMLWVTTGRWTYVLIGLVLFAIGTFVAAHLLGQINDRITVWLDPSKTIQGSGLQSIEGEFAFGFGGLYGTGLGMGHAGAIPVAYSDYIFAAIGEDLGMLGSVAIVVGFMLLIGSGLRAGLNARSEFAKLVAIGLTAVLGFQTFFIMAGVLRLLPLTGVTLPFVSYGGSSLVANYMLVALLMRISDEGSTTGGRHSSTAPT
ncbi:MAG TPA: FtsW/RodA/SpoVE family cell cycle protein, partial [Acidimicrobiales bacterium]|nr:FtsW/RodA/SpoVE family cell cycle protein [Acidimicrobiales bacterium]